MPDDAVQQGYQELPAADWWLVFEREAAWPEFRRRRGAPWWIRMWTDAEFRHVWAVRESSCGAGALAVQSLGTMLVVDWWPHPIDDVVASIRANGHRVVRVAGAARQCYLPGVSHCVTDTKRLLGIRAWWVWTPRQLWRYVHNRGLVRCPSSDRD